MAGIYVHIPFCKSKCVYCDFYSVPSREHLDEVACGLIAEFAARRGDIDEPFETLYIGGGTPSVLDDNVLARITGPMLERGIAEFTIEVNPDDVTLSRARRWAAMGVNRVSMGVQTFDDDLLRTIRRRHSADQAVDAVDMLHSAGITNISCDLIYGLPGQTADGWESDLRRLVSLPVTHLSAYCLTYYEGTPLWRMMQAGQVIPAGDDEIASRFDVLRRITAESGFEHYEISNFARPGFRSRHNSTYWRADGRWLGLGPSAYSFDGLYRRYNPGDIGRWLDRLPYPCEIDDETDLDRINDNIVTALRTSDGLDLDSMPADMADGLIADARRYLDSGDMMLSGRRLCINPDRWLTADAYIRDMIRDI
ncbi:MAG: radical SAM family heme chaperone HemW [Bacteroidales bacterium]|nr:radical SAM family heme chaperone HemW [Bacteroidales bacterium]